MKKVFTLIELIVVIAIIAILAAIIAPNAFRAIEKAKISKVIAEVDVIKTAALAYYADTGQWPSDFDSIHPNQLINPFLINPDPANITGWDGPYLESYGPHPWGGHLSWICSQDYGAIWENRGGCMVALDDDRPGTNYSDNQGKVPDSTMLRIDEIGDDGDLLTGNVRETTATGELGFLVTEF